MSDCTTYRCDRTTKRGKCCSVCSQNKGTAHSHWCDKRHPDAERVKPYETALEKTQRRGARLTGETYRLYVAPLEVPEDHNWTGQLQHLLDDLAHDAAELRDLLRAMSGWHPPQERGELERILELLKTFRFTRTRDDELFEEMDVTWYDTKVRERLERVES